MNDRHYEFADHLMYSVPFGIANDPDKRLEYLQRRELAASEICLQLEALRNKLLYWFGPMPSEYRQAWGLIIERAHDMRRAAEGAVRWETQLPRLQPPIPKE